MWLFVWKADNAGDLLGGSMPEQKQRFYPGIGGSHGNAQAYQSCDG
jgi:hypothetical protein